MDKAAEYEKQFEYKKPCFVLNREVGDGYDAVVFRTEPGGPQGGRWLSEESCVMIALDRDTNSYNLWNEVSQEQGWVKCWHVAFGVAHPKPPAPPAAEGSISHKGGGRGKSLKASGQTGESQASSANWLDYWNKECRRSQAEVRPRSSGTATRPEPKPRAAFSAALDREVAPGVYFSSAQPSTVAGEKGAAPGSMVQTRPVTRKRTNTRSSPRGSYISAVSRSEDDQTVVNNLSPPVKIDQPKVRPVTAEVKTGPGFLNNLREVLNLGGFNDKRFNWDQHGEHWLRRLPE